MLLLFALASWSVSRVDQVRAFHETLRPALTAEARNTALDARFPTMPMVRYVGAELGPDDLVYGLGYPCRVNYIPKVKHGYLRAFPEGVPEPFSEVWLEGMRRLGVTYVVTSERSLLGEPTNGGTSVRILERQNGYVLFDLTGETEKDE